MNDLAGNFDMDTDSIALAAVETEQAFLGALLYQPGLFWKVNDRLLPEHFFDGIHGAVYREISAKIVAGTAPSPQTIAIALGDALGEIGGAGYLIRLLRIATTTASAIDHADTIRELSIRRELRQITLDAADACMDMGSEVKTHDIISGVEAAIHEVVSRGGHSKRGLTATSAALQVYENARLAQQGGFQRGISSGLRAFDNANGLAMPGDLIVIGGATSMGKTALAQQIVWNAANSFACDKEGKRTAGARCVVFSMEMTSQQYMARHLSQLSGLTTDAMDGIMTDAELEKLHSAAQRIGDIPLTIEDARGLTVDRIRSICRRHQHTKGLDLVLIDHLGFVAKPERRMQQLEALESNVGAIKGLALELDCPVFLISHLNRGLWARDDKRPQLGDLHGSSAIEKDADAVCFVHREEYWLKKNMPDVKDSAKYAEWGDALQIVQGRAEIINGKRRRGRANQTELCNFHAETTRFYDLVRGA